MLKLIKERLGKPYFEIENCLLYNQDCSQALSCLPENLVDLTVTSPPYNIGKEYEKKMPLNDYLAWCETWIKQVHRVTTNDGTFWLNFGYLSIEDRAKAIPIPYLLWNRIPFFLIQEVVWNYGAGVAGKKFFSPRNEKFLWYVKNQQNYTFNLDAVRDKNIIGPISTKNGRKKVNPNGKNPGDVWYYSKITSGKNRSSKERTPHPAQFPMSLIDRIVKSSSNENDVICDPFSGSGTTAIVSLRNNRKFVGFELRKDYCEITIDRINTFLSNEKMMVK